MKSVEGWTWIATTSQRLSPCNHARSGPLTEGPTSRFLAPSDGRSCHAHSRDQSHLGMRHAGARPRRGSASAFVAGPRSPEALGITPSVTPVGVSRRLQCVATPAGMADDTSPVHPRSVTTGGLSIAAHRVAAGTMVSATVVMVGAAAPSRSSVMMARSAGSGAAIDAPFA